MHKAAHAYLQTQVTTTTQGELLLLLYDGAITFLTRAREKIAERDYAGKGILISKALDIISELNGSLNMEKGGELAQNLHKLYFYCTTRLFNANLKMDVALIDEVVKILTGLRGAYGQIINTPEALAVGASMAASRAPASAPLSRVPLPVPQPPLPASPAQSGRARAHAYGQQVQTGDAAAPTPPVQASGQRSGAAPAATPADTPPIAPVTPDAPVTAVAPGAPDAPSVSGFAPNRMAAASLYRKFAQG